MKKILMIDLMQVEFNNRALLEAKTLIKDGFDVTLIGFSYDPKFVGKRRINNVDCIAYKLYNGRKGIKKLFRYLSAFFVISRIWLKTLFTFADIYHAHNFQILIPASVASLLRKKRLIYDSHEIWTHHQDEKYALEHIFAFISEKLCAIRIDSLIGTNKLMEDFIRTKYKIKDSISIYNTPHQRNSLESEKRFHQHYGWSENIKVVLFQGGLWPSGRPLFEIINAAALLPDYIKVMFLGHGSTDFIEKIDNYIENKKLQDKVKLHPGIVGEGLLNYTASADIGLNFIKGNNLHQQYQCTWKIFEYCMVGLPVISSDYAFNRWIHEKYDIGLVIDSSDVKKISETIILVLNDSNMCSRFRKNALLASREFNWGAQERKLLQLYQGLAS